MEEHFDPYRKWLGIPPEEQPPHHYRLLGIAIFEDDPDVISNAADRQMAHVRTFQTGKRGSLSQALLNELSSAKVCLLNPQSKQQYDAQLLAYQSQLTRAVAVPAHPVAAQPMHPLTGLPMAIPVEQTVDSYDDTIEETVDDAVPTIRTNRKTKISFPTAQAPRAVSAPPAVVRPNAPRPVVAQPLSPDAGIAIADAPIGVTMRGTRAARRSSTSSIISIVIAVGLLAVLIFVAASFLGGDNSSSGGNSDNRAAGKDNASKDKSKSVTPKTTPTVPIVNAPTNDKPLDLGPRDKPKPPKTPGDNKPAEKTPSDKKPADKPAANSPDKPLEGQPTDKPVPDKGTRPVPTEADAPRLDNPPPPRPVEVKRPPAPAAAAIDKAYRIVRKEFEEELRNAREPEERIEIAQQIVERAAESDDPATQYALYQLAHNLGIQMASPEQACDTIDLLAAKFDVDAFEMKRQAIDEISQFVTHNLEDYEHLLRFMQRLARAALAGEKSDAAVAFSRLAKGTSLKVRSPKALKELPQLEDLLAQVDALAADVTEYDREVKAFDRNSKQLQKEPGDAPANLGVAKYWLFVRGDWAKALPHFAKAADPAWKDPATLDLAGPKTPAEQAALADAWAALAPRKGGLAKPRLLERAAAWYAKALAAAPEADKPAIQTKLTAVENQQKVLRAAIETEAGTAAASKESTDETDGQTKPEGETSEDKKADGDEPAFPD